MIDIAEHCQPCESGTAPLDALTVEHLLLPLDGWDTRGNAIVKRWSFKNFKQAQAFVNQIGALAEAENHHPDIAFGWGYAEITLTTHSIGGLSENDFIIAKKINALPAA